MTTRRATLLAAPALALPAAAHAQAEWPQRPVTMLVPFVAGGPSDIVARVIAGQMGQTIGQPVVAENRPGRTARSRRSCSRARRRTGTR